MQNLSCQILHYSVSLNASIPQENPLHSRELTAVLLVTNNYQGCFISMLDVYSPFYICRNALCAYYCHNPNEHTTQPQHNLNTVVGLDTKMTLYTTPPPTISPQKLNCSLQKPQITNYSPQLNIV